MITTGSDPYTMTVFSASTGASSVRLDRKDGTFLHLHSLVDPEAEADCFSDLDIWGDKLVLAGTGLGYHLSRVLRNVGNLSGILIIEYYPDLAESCADFVKEVTSIAPLILTGDTADIQIIEKRFASMVGTVQVIRHPPSYEAHRTFYDARLKRLLIRRTTGCGCKTMAQMQGRFFVEREMIHAAEAAEINAIPFHYRDVSSVVAYESHVQQLIERNAPDFILSINMLGVDYNGILAEYASRHGIPTVHWFVDDPRPILLTRKDITSDMIACTWDASYLPFLQEAGFGEVHYLPLAVDAFRPVFDANVLPGIPVCFVGSSMSGEFLQNIADKFIWRVEYGTVASQLARDFLAGRSDTLDDDIRNALAGYGTTDAVTVTWLRSYVLHLASMMRRRELLAGLIPFGLELFGDETGWKNLLGGEVSVHPDLDYHTETARIYNNTAVNVNITSCQMPYAVNQRVFDVPCSGGFLLTDHQKDMDVLFEQGEYVVYADKEDLREKTVYYLDHPQERAAITMSARRTVLDRHTYQHRLAEIVSFL